METLAARQRVAPECITLPTALQNHELRKPCILLQQDLGRSALIGKRFLRRRALRNRKLGFHLPNPGLRNKILKGTAGWRPLLLTACMRGCMEKPSSGIAWEMGSAADCRNRLNKPDLGGRPAASLVSRLNGHLWEHLWCPLCGSVSTFAARLWTEPVLQKGPSTRLHLVDPYPSLNPADPHSHLGVHSPLSLDLGRPLIGVALALSLVLHLSVCTPAHATSTPQEPPCVVAPSPKATASFEGGNSNWTGGNHLEQYEFHVAAPDYSLGAESLESVSVEDQGVLKEVGFDLPDVEEPEESEGPQASTTGGSFSKTSTSNNHVKTGGSEQEVLHTSKPQSPAAWATLSVPAVLSHPPQIPHLKLPPWLNQARLQQFLAEAGEAWGKMNLTITRNTIHCITRGWWFGLPRGLEVSEQAYVVRAGESLGSVAGFLGVPVEDLKATNPGVSNPLTPGQSLQVPMQRQLVLVDRKWRKRKRKPGKGVLSFCENAPRPIRAALLMLTDKWDRVSSFDNLKLGAD
jgi:hypothetical protein